MTNTIQQTTIKNGLRIITAPQTGTDVVTVVVYVHTGSRNETKHTNGIAHFIEHLTFKGTKKYPDSKSIAKNLDRIGADYNAYTSKEYTGYYIKVSRVYLELALDILSEMTLRPRFEKNDIERERGVIIEEINMYEDTPMYLNEEVFESFVFGKHSTLGRRILGSIETITAMTRAQIVAFHREHYTPGNMVVAVSGACDHTTPALVARFFKTTRSTHKTKRITTRSTQPKESVKVYKKNTEQIHLALGLTVPVTHTDTDRLALQIANTIFGATMSSRLFSRIREQHGLGYYIHSDFNSFYETSTWVVQAGVDHKRLHQAVQLIMQQWQLLARGITKAEFTDVQTYYQGKVALQFEDSAVLAQWYARRALFGQKLYTPEEYLEQILAVSRDQINKLLNGYLTDAAQYLSVIGAVDAAPLKKFVS